MAFKTQGVQVLVKDAIKIIPKPYGEDIIEDVALAIENDAQLRLRYAELCAVLSKWVVNSWIGQYAKRIAGMKRFQQVAATKATIIGSYTKLQA